MRGVRGVWAGVAGGRFFGRWRRGGVVVFAAIAVLFVASPGMADEVTIPDVPAYLWTGGCAPTAGGMVMGYYDAHGYGGLISAGDGTNSWSTNREVIEAMIASDGYFEDWWPKPDADPPYHEDDCLADFMHTSRGSLDAGWSVPQMIDNGLIEYAEYRGYGGGDSDLLYQFQLWDALVEEVDAGRPMVFFVDSTASGSPDHFVTAIGYDDDADRSRYACYDTYDGNVHWYDFDRVRTGVPYGIYQGVRFHMGPELLGDFNDDGAMNGLDIPGFKEALADPDGWAASTGFDPHARGDFDGNGALDGLDIPGFKDGLAGTAIPEPGGLCLALGALALCRRRRRGSG